MTDYTSSATSFASASPAAPAAFSGNVPGVSAAQPTQSADDISAYHAPTSAPVSQPMSAPVSPMQTSSPAVAPAPMSAPTPPTAPTMPPAKSEADSESLESQNIFALLGVNDGAEADKEAFLDELQEVIWQDFLANDLQLLLTREELDQVTAIQAKTTDVTKQQEEMVAFLEKLIPDLEDIMLEKALELKRQMVHERVSGLRTYLAGKPDQLLKLESAEQLIKQNQWAKATTALNALQ